MGERYIYFFGGGPCEIDPARKDILGGKGASLAAMSKAGLPVPPGFTLSAECCPRFLEGGGAWPRGLEAELRAHLERLERVTGRVFGQFPRPLLVSVRSGAAASMPGMMDTLLNCGVHPGMTGAAQFGVWEVYAQFVQMFAKTVAEIPVAEFQNIAAGLARETGKDRARFGDAEHEELASRYRAHYEKTAARPFPHDPWSTLVACVEAVWRSWNSERAIAYRKQHDIRGILGTAVNVQSMFPSQVSGIVFTANPNDLAAGEMIVESSYGLGEAVVSGEVTPDRFHIDRKTLAVKKSVLGNKAHLVRALGDERAYRAQDASLDGAHLGELAALSMKVEAYYGAPVDLEWGLADGKFNLLQARPIRGLEIARDVEVCREEEIARLRALANGSRRVWVAHNLGETLPLPTPMTWDLVRHFMSGAGGFGRMYLDFGYRPSSRVRKEGFLETICGRIYADPERAAELFWTGMPLEYDQELILRDANALEAPPAKFNPEKADAAFLFRLPGTLWAMLRSARRMTRMRAHTRERFEREILPPFLAYTQEKRAQDLARLPLAGLHAEFRERRRRVLDEFANESLQPGFFGGMARAALEAALIRLAGDEEGKRLTLELSMGLDGDLTIEQNELLFEVAQGEAQMKDFIARFGHRTVGEMELAEPRWREDASYLDKMLSAYREGAAQHPAELHHAHAEKRKEAEAALPEWLAKHGGSSLREDIEADLRDAQALLPYRENGKYYLMQGYELLRLALLEYARRWDLGRDVFFLELGELERFETDRDALLARIAARKIRWQAAKRLELAETIDSADLESLGKPKHYEAASELKGDAIAAGVFTGPARIVFDPQEAKDLGTGFVLVCPSTDPGWTALFVHAKGLIVERGGVLSHGAIVARDFGIPAVVCHDATRRVPEGATVRVDGNRGLITVLSSGQGA